MRTTVVVPTRNNSKTLGDCIRSLKKQTEKAELIIVSPRGDAAQALAKKLGCKWVEDRKNTIGNAYNAGAAKATGDIVAFTDDDCIVPITWVSSLVKDMKAEDLDVTGGDDVIDRKRSTPFQNAVFMIDLARTVKKPIYGRNACRRLRACNIAFKKSLFKEQNFNTNLKGLQEPELLHRLFKDGKKIKFNPAIKVEHTRRNSLGGVFNQIYRNGKAKIQLLKIHRDMLSPIDILPVFLLFYTLGLAYLALTSIFFAQFWFVTVALYLIGKALAIALRTTPCYFPYLLEIVFAREIAYSLGILIGLITIAKRD